MMAFVKHFACNSMENARLSVDIEVDEVALHEAYVPQFRSNPPDRDRAFVMAREMLAIRMKPATAPSGLRPSRPRSLADYATACAALASPEGGELGGGLARRPRAVSVFSSPTSRTDPLQSWGAAVRVYSVGSLLTRMDDGGIARDWPSVVVGPYLTVKMVVALVEL